MLQSWFVISIVTLLVALGSLLIRPRDIPWAKRLDRPKWLFFEPAIPFIWIAIFLAGAASATLVWEANPGTVETGLLMALYLLVEVVTVAYIPATLRSHSLALGTILGALGATLAGILILIVFSISSGAALLLLPYLIWSPIGTYATSRMIDLNPDAV